MFSSHILFVVFWRWIVFSSLLSFSSVILFFSYPNSVSAVPDYAIELDSNSRDVIELAYTALLKIQDLSETGIYRQITLNNIYSAHFVDGIYHRNTILNVSLASNHFLSGKRDESFEFVVMERKEEEDGEEYEQEVPQSAMDNNMKINSYSSNDDLTIAINEFPVMDPRALEAFYVEMVERKRRERNRLLNLYSS